jgi:nicotinamide riboside transporter PnuC
MTPSYLGREPAQWLGLLSAAVALFSAVVLPLSVGQQGALIAVATAVFGVAGALAVSGEKAAPFVAGLVQSVLALALAFGAQLSPEVQGSIMAFVAAGVGWYLRTQVVAPVPDATTAPRAA